MMGIASFDAVAEANDVGVAVNAHLGRPFINAMGVRAFQNAIDAAKKACRRGEPQR
ncbi:MAG TPA: hypothetical protein VFK79_13280 [Xanthobacteraceae bacterium]|nr:hypothetical protein [Xanthobacteraceae bacterium]